MPTYIDIGAVRIQEWLARTPKLRLRRGASAALSDATSEPSVSEALPPGVRWNNEAGDVDGVVNLRLDSAEDDLVRQAIASVVGRLRRDLPALDWTAGVASAADYYSAYPELQASRGSGRYAPAPARAAELCFALPCRACGLDPATATVELPTDDNEDASWQVCRDCAARSKAAGRASRDPSREPAATRMLRGWLAEAELAAQGAAFPVDFKSLARLAGSDATHIATIHADGNALGTAFGSAPTGAKKSELAQAVREATRHGVIGAIRAIVAPDDDHIPIIVHVIGGDDVLLSVPADRAWRFVRAYLGGFGEAMAGPTRSIVGSPGITASAGVVFSHQSFPFGLAIEAAERCLREAKRTSGPDVAAVSWLEVTSDGHLAAPHGPWLLSQLDQRWDELNALSGVPASQRSRLARLQGADFSDQLRRMDLGRVKGLGTGWPGQRTALDETRIKDALRIVRWWS